MALSISLWLSIVGFLYPAKIIRSPPPISVDACRNTYMRVTNSSSYFPPTPKPWAPGEGYIIAYRLSYVWNAALSVFIVLVVSIVTSLLTNPQDPRTLNPNLIGRPFDVLCPWISKKILDSLAFNVGEDYVSYSPLYIYIYLISYTKSSIMCIIFPEIWLAARKLISIYRGPGNVI